MQKPTPKHPLCRARRKNGTPCGNFPVEGKDLCRMHGGAVGSGGNHNLKHGRYSKSLGRLASVYESSREDRNLFDLREPIAALDSVTQRLMTMVDEHDSPEWRRALKTKYGQLREALSSGDPRAAELLEEVGQLIDAGAGVGSNLEHLGSNLDKLARRIEGAWSIHLQKTQVVNKTDLVSMLSRFLVFVREEAGSSCAARVQDRMMLDITMPARVAAAASEVREHEG